MSKRIFLRLLLAFTFAFSGSAAQLHSLGHAHADLAAAAVAGRGKKAPSPLKHSTDQCLVVHVLDGTAAESSAFLLTTAATHRILPVAEVRSGESPAAAFNSRAPPALS